MPPFHSQRAIIKAIDTSGHCTQARRKREKTTDFPVIKVPFPESSCSRFGLGRKGGAFLLDHLDLVSLPGPHFLGSREQHLLWSVETSYHEEKLSCDLELLLRG